MRQRLGIAAALLRDPQLLLLDEPATGLDPAGMRDMRALIRRLADEGMTVLLSSHLLAEVEELCNRVAIVRTGAIVYEGAIAELKRTAGATYRLRTTDDERARSRSAASSAGSRDVRTERRRDPLRRPTRRRPRALGRARRGGRADPPRSRRRPRRSRTCSSRSPRATAGSRAAGEPEPALAEAA